MQSKLRNRQPNRAAYRRRSAKTKKRPRHLAHRRRRGHTFAVPLHFRPRRAGTQVRCEGRTPTPYLPLRTKRDQASTPARRGFRPVPGYGAPLSLRRASLDIRPAQTRRTGRMVLFIAFSFNFGYDTTKRAFRQARLFGPAAGPRASQCPARSAPAAFSHPSSPGGRLVTVVKIDGHSPFACLS